MNKKQTLNLVQLVVVFGAGWLLGKGLADHSAVEDAGGGLAALITAAISHKVSGLKTEKPKDMRNNPPPRSGDH